MSERVPTFMLLVPGPFRDPSEVVGKLTAAGLRARVPDDEPLLEGDIEVRIIEDDRLGNAFLWGRGGELPAELRQSIARSGRAALIEVAFRLDRDHAVIAKLGRALRAAGGLAVRMAKSGGAATWDWWLERMESGSVRDIYECAVVLVGDDSGEAFTCGMHHFDRPDVEIAASDLNVAAHWLDMFNIYSLVDDPLFVSGQTFRPDEESPRRVFVRWPDRYHAASDGRYNPCGFFRFLDEGVAPQQLSKLVPNIMPALVVTLAALESRKGKPLTKKEVEDFVEKAPAIMMSREHVRALERTRGYADIDPELAWEQWQIVRKTNQSNG